MSDTILSVLIPCYNSGKYLPDALKSISQYSDESFYEIIIVNDGSTDSATISILNTLQQQGYNVINQENKGPAAARNTAANYAKGKYLLLLDSDNIVCLNYITKGVKILDEMPDVSIVHGRPFFFGELSDARTFETGKFDITKMLIHNYIDTCTIIRKSAWDQLSGQDEDKRIIGHEDWEFWLRAGNAKHNFYFLDEICFDYRISSNSLVTNYVQNENWQKSIQYIYTKYQQLLFEQYKLLYVEKLIYEQDKQRPFRSFLKFFFNKYFKK